MGHIYVMSQLAEGSNGIAGWTKEGWRNASREKEILMPHPILATRDERPI